MPSAYSATGTSDSGAAVTAYPYVTSGVERVGASRAGLLVGFAAVGLGLLM
jgi:hypothetical protein